MTTELIYPNGINGDNGNYLIPPFTPRLVSDIACGEEIDTEHIKELSSWWHNYLDQEHLGPVEGVNPKVLAEAGWGIIFARSDPNAEAIKEALGELLNLRREQAGEYYKEYFGADGCRPNESKGDFLERYKTGPGPADPKKVPYYLLIIGSPELISFKFQYQLDVQYAVGRLDFEKLEDYANYARNVVNAESGKVKSSRRAVFFGVQNQGDEPTNLSSQYLVKPLSENAAFQQNNWTVEKLLKENATKKQLKRILGGPETPAFLFTASHGIGFSNGNPRQLAHQGAIVCQDWAGPNAGHGSVLPEHYFSADDVSEDVCLSGLISFHFACFSAGTPMYDEFIYRTLKTPIAPSSFVAQLPQRLLSRPNGNGALAFIGHIERAWGYSFIWQTAGPQLQVFESTLKRLIEGHPVGSALEYFNQRYAEISTELTSELEEINYGKKINETKLAGMWIANNDARNYAIIGDPAVRLPLAA